MEDKLMDKFIEKEIDKEEELVIPNSINIKLDKSYEAIRQGNITEKQKKNYRFKKIAIAASLVFVIFSTIVANPALANNLPGLNQLLNYFKSNYWFNDNYISNADKINITQKDKGIEINLEGVIYDESSLKFIYTLTSEKKLQWGVQFRKNSLKINGKNIVSDGSRMDSEEEKISNDDDEVEKYAVITTFDISNLKLENNVDIDWTINEIHTWDTEYESGNWKFNFKTSKNELKANSKILNVNYSIEEEGYKSYIDKIILTPIEVKMIGTEDIRLNKDLEDARNKYEKDPIDVEAKERLNRLRRIRQELDLGDINITDENGNSLIMTSGKGVNEAYVYLYKPLKNLPKKLILTPKDRSDYIMYDSEENFMYCPSDDQYIPLEDIKTPFEYNQGENMSVVINSIENSHGKIKINATFKGDFIADRVSNAFQIIPKGIKYPNKAEEMNKFYDLLDSINATNTQRYQYAEKANNDNNTFDYEYELRENEEYNLVFRKIPNGEYKKDKQTSVDIK